MMKFTGLLSILVSLTACASTHSTQRKTSSLNVPFEVQGHRGARWSRPENTLSAFQFALDAGVDTLEMDLNVTRDNVLVVTHDPYLNPATCLDSRGRRIRSNVMIRRLTLAELKTYDCGSLVNPLFKEQVPQPGERIPTFEEFLTWLQNHPNPRAKIVRLNVETKSEKNHPEFTPEPRVFSKMVLDMAKKFKVMDRMTLQSFDFRTLIAAREIDASTVTSALVEFRPREGLTAMASRLNVNIVSPNHEWLTEAEVASLHKAGVQVLPWTVNALQDWQRMLKLGVDGIISDNPKALLTYRSGLSNQ
jgi:glycerophosphoryl diester phosphodiesterase